MRPSSRSRRDSVIARRSLRSRCRLPKLDVRLAALRRRDLPCGPPLPSSGERATGLRGFPTFFCFARFTIAHDDGGATATCGGPGDWAPAPDVSGRNSACRSLRKRRPSGSAAAAGIGSTQPLARRHPRSLVRRSKAAGRCARRKRRREASFRRSAFSMNSNGRSRARDFAFFLDRRAGARRVHVVAAAACSALAHDPSGNDSLPCAPAPMPR